MNYQKVYNSIISIAKRRDLAGYGEYHHIIPRCLGGDDSKDNVVKLSAREHYVCHQLLAKLYPKHTGLVYAARLMSVGGIGQNRSQNRLYEWIRTKHKALQSIAMKGENNHRYRAVWVFNTTLQESQSVPENEVNRYLNNGWEKGRIIDFDKHLEKLKQDNINKEKQAAKKKERLIKYIHTKHNAKRRSKEYRVIKAKVLYPKFILSNKSLNNFAKENNMVPMTLSKLFKEFIPEYNITPRKAANKQI